MYEPAPQFVEFTATVNADTLSTKFIDTLFAASIYDTNPFTTAIGTGTFDDTASERKHPIVYPSERLSHRVERNPASCARSVFVDDGNATDGFSVPFSTTITPEDGDSPFLITGFPDSITLSSVISLVVIVTHPRGIYAELDGYSGHELICPTHVPSSFTIVEPSSTYDCTSSSHIFPVDIVTSCGAITSIVAKTCSCGVVVARVASMSAFPVQTVTTPSPFLVNARSEPYPATTH
jgi:hypothetical protein